MPHSIYYHSNVRYFICVWSLMSRVTTSLPLRCLEHLQVLLVEMGVLGALSSRLNQQRANQLSTRFTIAYLIALCLMLLIESLEWILDKPFKIKGRCRSVQAFYREYFIIRVTLLFLIKTLRLLLNIKRLRSLGLSLCVFSMSMHLINAWREGLISEAASFCLD